MTELEFFELCAAHDWHYPFADDYGAWKKGEAEHRAITEALKQHPEYRTIYEEWVRYVSHGAPKPAPCCFLVHQAV